MKFSDLQLIEPLQRAVAAEGYTVPTPIQQKAIPHLLAGRDLVGCAQTGTGKTAAFALPLLQRLWESRPADGSARGRRPIRVLVLTPTRELASQIGESFAVYGRHLGMRHSVVFGGVGQDAQSRALAAGIDILIATPGRLLDLMSQRLVAYDKLEAFVLDEADRMLDMGFIHDVRRVIAALPQKRQTLLFSATMPEEIRTLSSTILRDPVRVEVTPVASTAEKVEQSVYFVEKAGKRPLLEQLLKDAAVTRALVFTRTKHGANRVAEQLERANVQAQAIHGNKSQNARERALAAFKAGTVRVLVATDIAARGIDIDGISHVVNYDLPNIPESYVHRIGRTARAGAAGIAISFCDREERAFLADIERLIRMRVPVIADHAFKNVQATAEPERERPREGRGGGRGHQRGHAGSNERSASGGGSGEHRDGRRGPAPSSRGPKGPGGGGRPSSPGGGGGRPSSPGGGRKGRTKSTKSIEQVMAFWSR